MNQKLIFNRIPETESLHVENYLRYMYCHTAKEKSILYQNIVTKRNIALLNVDLYNRPWFKNQILAVTKLILKDGYIIEQ